MVRLDRIRTGGGDGGTTSLGDGSRVSKASLRIAAQGDVDEAGAAVGIARCRDAPPEADAMLSRIQNDLFDLGADISRPGADDGKLRVQADQVARLERETDAVAEELAPLDSFVLRGGGEFAAALHFACTVCRRAERSVCALAADETVNPQAIAFLNRLSDLLFVMARAANDGGRADVLWQPGANRDGGRAPPGEGSR